MSRSKGLQFDWAIEACDELRRLNATGLFSCSQMANQLQIQFGGPISRNAVIGKLGRLGLVSIRPKGPAKGTPRPPRLKYRPTINPPAFRRPRATEPDMPKKHWHDPIALDFAIPLDQRCTFEELRDHHCRWIVGDPQQPDHFYCGMEVLEGHSYCNNHCLRAYARFAPPEQAEAA